MADEPSDLAPATIRSLSAARGVPLHLLLFLYRWARAYSSVPGGPDAGRRALFNRTHQASVSSIADEVLGSHSRENTLAIQRALARLRELRIVAIIAEPGKRSTYAPHALDFPLALPQHLWRDGWLRDPDNPRNGMLDGSSLRVLLYLVGYRRLPLATLEGWTSSSDELKALARRSLIVVPEARLAGLPLSAKQRRAALDRLERRGIVQRVTTQGTSYVICLEPGH